MKRKIMIGSVLFFCVVIAVVCFKNVSKTDKDWHDTLKDGDLIFQINIAGQGKAVQLATHSEYTHIGILFKESNEWMVYEAVEPVQKTPLNAFIEHGDKGQFVIKRLRNAASLLTNANISKMKNYAEQQLDKHYDIYFGWDDDILYCSELVWKCYNEMGVTIGPLKPLKTFDLSSPAVRKIMNQRYGTNIPYEENVISPGDIFDRENLITVFSN